MKQFPSIAPFTLVLMTASAQDLKPIAYADGDQKLNGLVLRAAGTGSPSNAGAKPPGVLLLPAWMGVDDEARTTAKELAERGCTVFIADIYGEGQVPATPADAREKSGYYKQHPAAYQHRIALALDALKANGADPGRIVVIGYCFGGAGALEAARAQLPVKGVVSIHGSLGKGDRPNGPISASVLIQHPDADASVSAADLASIREELNAANTDWQLITYSQCKHTFTNPASPDYNEVMAKRAWQHLVLFLGQMLP